MVCVVGLEICFKIVLTLKNLGGYDPYMNEYVLSSNDVLLPQKIESIPCGSSNTIDS